MTDAEIIAIAVNHYGTQATAQEFAFARAILAARAAPIPANSGELESPITQPLIAEAARDDVAWGAEFPMQPIITEGDGVVRFKENRIVNALLRNSDKHGFGLNETRLGNFTADEHMQLAQLIGYSISGYGGLSYVSDASYDKAAAIAASKGGAMKERHIGMICIMILVYASESLGVTIASGEPMNIAVLVYGLLSAVVLGAIVWSKQ